MKKYIKLALAAVGCTVVLGACNDNYESLPVDQYTEDFLFSTTDSAGTKALGFISTIYDALPNGHFRVGNNYLDAASDDALSINNSSDCDVLKLQLGQYTPSTRVSSEMTWGSWYQAIRKANIFINGVDRVPFKATYVNALGETRQMGVSLKAEARFLRAYFYFELLRRYGGVPLLGDKVYDINDNLELPRNTFGECVDYIVSELDLVKDSLRPSPIVDSGTYGHAVTKEACDALKSRVLLYAASPLFNERPIEANNELVGYAAYDADRWKQAADAARDFIAGYGLDGTKTFKLTSNFRNVFLGYYQKLSNPELIFFRQGSSNSTSIENNNGPLGFSGSKLGHGYTNPTQNLVDAFTMKDGKPIGMSDKYVYDSQNPYANRDPRLDLTVLHHGSQWLGTTLQTNQGGAHNPSSGEQYSQTSYFSCKFMGDFTSKTEYSGVYHHWVMFRYAEMLLNYAEATNEYYGPAFEEVIGDEEHMGPRKAIEMLRKRAGIEAGADGLYGIPADLTKEEMREIIHNERRVELAFEEHRYFDIRRWREAEEIYKRPLQGMNIQVGMNTTSYSVIDLLDVQFDIRRYFYPIPYSEVIKNENMVQNPNWN